jgi:serine protease Do
MKAKKSLYASLFAFLLLVSQINAQDSNGQVLEQTGKAIAQVSAKASAAVVSVRFEIESTADEDEQSQIEQFLKKFFGQGNSPFQMPRRQPQQKQYTQGLGSGFVVDSNGYIMTNYHVVSEANTVTVRFGKGTEYKAKVVGKDPPTDLALIKIDAGNLPMLELGDSDKIEVGEWVIAIGNPFGLSSTVTVGVVSGKGRTGIGIEDYEDFIQTDAAINMGNSGGPLINARGEVIGINTAIVSGSGGNVGIGFAIPSNMAKLVYQQLKTEGHVTRGYLGILMQPLTPKLAQKFGVKGQKGILISDVVSKSPADQAGLRNGDVIIRMNERDVNEVTQFRNYVAMQKPGSEAKLYVVRDGKEKEISVQIGTMPVKSKTPEQQEQGQQQQQKIGLKVQNLTPDIAEQLGYQNEKGVVIIDVDSGSPADEAGLQPGMLIAEVDKKPVNNVDEFYKLAKKGIQEGSVMLLVKFKDVSQYVVIDMK